MDNFPDGVQLEKLSQIVFFPSINDIKFRDVTMSIMKQIID